MPATEASDQSEAETIKSIRTDEKIFAMTVVVTGDEKTTDLEALANLCGDFGVSPTYFITPDWAEENAELCAKLSEKGGALGLYIEDDLRSKSRSTVLKYISEENERFYVALGQYPRYVRAADGGTERCRRCWIPSDNTCWRPAARSVRQNARPSNAETSQRYGKSTNAVCAT